MRIAHCQPAMDGVPAQPRPAHGVRVVKLVGCARRPRSPGWWRRLTLAYPMSPICTLRSFEPRTSSVRSGSRAPFARRRKLLLVGDQRPRLAHATEFIANGRRVPGHSSNRPGRLRAAAFGDHRHPTGEPDRQQPVCSCRSARARLSQQMAASCLFTDGPSAVERRGGIIS